MFNILTIDADYWFPYARPGHCGFCTDRRRRHDLLLKRKNDYVVLRTQPFFKSKFRTSPSIQEICALVSPGTPIKVTESHAAMFGIVTRLRRAGEKHIHVINIDEHEDYEDCDDENNFLNCGNWAWMCIKKNWITYYHIGKEVNFYTWSQHTSNYHPDLIHVCRSSPYLAKVGDRSFADLVAALEKTSGVKARVFGYNSKRLKMMINYARVRNVAL